MLSQSKKVVRIELHIVVDTINKFMCFQQRYQQKKKKIQFEGQNRWNDSFSRQLSCRDFTRDA